jgi:hypothetical protein
VQLICLGTTLVTGGLAALFGTAVHQFGLVHRAADAINPAACNKAPEEIR